MRFADPQACPDCRGVISGQTSCPHCGLDLTSVEVRQLWQTLLQADELLARAAQRRAPAAPARAASPPVAPTQAAPPPTPGPTAPTAPGAPTVPTAPGAPVVAPPPPPVPPSFQPFPAPARAAAAVRPPRRWSVGTVLLVLGPFSLIVAGLIFVTRSWEDVGLAARTAILVGITAVIGALGVWVTRRPLRASAESVWTIFLSLLTLDFFAARHEGLVGLGGINIQWAWVVWGVVALALSVGIAVWARPAVSAALVAPAVAGGLAITMAGIGAGAVVEDLDFAWRAVIALVVAGLLALATRPAGLRPMTITARVVVAGFFLAAYVAAFVDLVDHPALDDLVGGGHGAPMALMAVAALVVARLVAPVRIAATALAVFALCAVVVTPVADASDVEGVWVAVAALAALLAVAGARGTDDWMRGLRVGALPAVVGIVLLNLGLLLDAVRTAGEVIDDPWSSAWDTRLDVAAVDNYAVWAAPVVLVGLLVVAWFVPRWPEVSAAQPHALDVVVGAAAVGGIGAVVTMRPPVWAVALALLALAAVLLAVQARRLAVAAAPAALLLVVAASALTVGSHGVSAVTWLAGSAIIAGLAMAPGPVPPRQAYAAVAVGLELAADAAIINLLDVDESVSVLVVLVAALGFVAAAGTLLVKHPTRIAVEAAAAVGGVVALLSSAPSGELAVRWTVVGVALIALGLAVPGRRWYLWPGAAALVVAYVLLIVDSGFSFVEAYTLPLGIVALAVGLYVVRHRPEIGTWLVLGPGLAISMLPSLPQSLAEPTEVRALLLGLGAVVALVLGVRLGWQAPFVSGAVVLTLLVLFNIGPYANAAPRVVLLAIVGAVLTGIGITWEDRVRDGRKLVGYVRAMR